MLSEKTEIIRVKEWLGQKMREYLDYSIRTGNTDSIILPIEDIFSSSEEGNQIRETLILETKSAIEEVYTVNIERDIAIDYKLVYYGLLLSGLCYIIDIGDDYLRKDLYTLSIESLYNGYDESLLVGKDINEDIADKIGKIIYSINNGNRLLKTLIKDRNYTSGIFTVRYDKAYHIDGDMRMHYTPVTPNGTIDLNSIVLIPKEVYEWVQHRLIEHIHSGVFLVCEENRKSLVSLNPVVLKSIYEEERLQELLKVADISSSISIPEIGASRYTRGTRTFNLESIDKIIPLSDSSVEKVLKKEPLHIGGIEIQFDLIDIDVRGAKRYLKEKLNYDSLDQEQKNRVDAYTDEKAYRYLKSKGVDFKGYSEKFGKLNKQIILPDTEEELRQLLWSGIYEITLLTRKGESKLICSSNENIIEEIYGEDYRIYCNSENSRLREFYRKLVYCYRAGDPGGLRKLIERDMFIKFGISLARLELESGATPESIIKSLEQEVGSMKESTQNSMQILTTCLTDKKPKVGYGRNLLRSFYLDNVLKIVKLR